MWLSVVVIVPLHPYEERLESGLQRWVIRGLVVCGDACGAVITSYHLTSGGELCVAHEHQEAQRAKFRTLMYTTLELYYSRYSLGNERPGWDRWWNQQKKLYCTRIYSKFDGVNDNCVVYESKSSTAFVKSINTKAKDVPTEERIRRSCFQMAEYLWIYWCMKKHSETNPSQMLFRMTVLAAGLRSLDDSGKRLKKRLKLDFPVNEAGVLMKGGVGDRAAKAV